MNGQGDIRISIADTNQNILIQLQDNGSGINDDDLEKIFEPLFSTKQKGTGLGLSSCKSIVQQHGGTITASNNPTIFTIKIPKRIEEKIENE